MSCIDIISCINLILDKFKLPRIVYELWSDDYFVALKPNITIYLCGVCNLHSIKMIEFSHNKINLDNSWMKCESTTLFELDCKNINITYADVLSILENSGHTSRVYQN